MILTHSLLRRNVTEDVGLLLIGSSHAHWTRTALLRCNFSDFFSSLLDKRSVLTIPAVGEIPRIASVLSAPFSPATRRELFLVSHQPALKGFWESLKAVSSSVKLLSSADPTSPFRTR